MSPFWKGFLALSATVLALSIWELSLTELPAKDEYQARYLYGPREYDSVRYPSPRPCTAGPNGDGCLFSLFVGVGITRSGLRAWGGRTNTIALERAFVQRGLIREEHTLSLLDTETTTRSITAASRQLAAAMQPKDTFLLFINAHGGQGLVAVNGGLLTERAVRTILRTIPARQVIVIIEACHSGSFASLAQEGGRRRKTVVGIFSTEANQLSWNDIYTQEGSFAQAMVAAVYSGSRDGLVRTSTLGPFLQAFTQEHNRYVQANWQHPIVRGPDVILWRAYPHTWTTREPFTPSYR